MRHPREAFLQSGFRGLVGAVALTTLGSSFRHTPEAHAQTGPITLDEKKLLETVTQRNKVRITDRNNLTVVSNEELRAFRQPYKLVGLIYPHVLPVVFPPEGDFEIKDAVCRYSIAGAYREKPGIAFTIPDKSFTIFTSPAYGEIIAYGAKEPRTGLIQVNRVEFADNHWVFEFQGSTSAYLLPPTPSSSQSEGFYAPGEPIIVATKSLKAPRAINLRPVENVARGDALMRGIQPEQVDIISYPTESDVFISIVPYNLNDWPNDGLYEIYSTWGLSKYPNTGKYLCYLERTDRQPNLDQTIALLSSFGIS